MMRYTQPFSIVLMKPSKDLCVIFCKWTEISENSALYDTFTDRVPFSNWHSPKEFSPTSMLTECTNIAVTVMLLLAIERESGTPSHVWNKSTSKKQFCKWGWFHDRVRVMSTESIKSITCLSFRCPKTLPVLEITALVLSIICATTILSPFTLASNAASLCGVCFGHLHFILGCLLVSREALSNMANISSESKKRKNYSDCFQ